MLCPGLYSIPRWIRFGFADVRSVLYMPAVLAMVEYYFSARCCLAFLPLADKKAFWAYTNSEAPDQFAQLGVGSRSSLLVLYLQQGLYTLKAKNEDPDQTVKARLDLRCDVVGCGEGVVYLSHRSVQLILAYRWARPAILIEGKGRGECFHFFYFFTSIHVPLSSLPLSFVSSTISSISLFPLSVRRHKMTNKGWRVVKPQHNHSMDVRICSKVSFLNRQPIYIMCFIYHAFSYRSPLSDWNTIDGNPQNVW